jgi:hypothetical protein
MWVDVEQECNDWYEILNNKSPEYFVLGNNFISPNKFLLISINESETIFTNEGQKIKTKLSLSLEEFIRQGYKQDKKTKTGKAGAKKQKVDYTSVIDSKKVRDNTNVIESILGGTK